MIKASEGGGGKGIRLVRNESDFEVNFRRVQVHLMRLSFPGDFFFFFKLWESK